MCPVLDGSGDYHEQINSDSFEKWVNEKFIPKLPIYHCPRQCTLPWKALTANQVISKENITECHAKKV
jgi:hypothetical protein